MCTRVLVFIFSSHCPSISTPPHTLASSAFMTTHCGSARAMATGPANSTGNGNGQWTPSSSVSSSSVLPLVLRLFPALCACLTLSPLANLFSVCWHFSCLPSCRCCLCCCCRSCCCCLLLLTKGGGEANANTKTNTRHCHGADASSGKRKGKRNGKGKEKSGEGGYLLVVVAGKSYRLRKRNVTGQKAVSKAAAATEIMASAM